MDVNGKMNDKVINQVTEFILSRLDLNSTMFHYFHTTIISQKKTEG